MSRRGSDNRLASRSLKSLYPTCQIADAERARDNCSPRTAFDRLQTELEKELQNSERVLCAASNYKGTTSRNVCDTESDVCSRPICCEAWRAFDIEKTDISNVCPQRCEPEYVPRPPRLEDSGIICAKKPSVRLSSPKKSLSRNTSPRSNTRRSSPVRCDSPTSKIRKPGSPIDVRRKESQTSKNKYSPPRSSPRNQSIESKRYLRSDVSINNQSLKSKKFSQVISPDYKISETRVSRSRSIPQSENQSSRSRSIPQSENQSSGERSYAKSENQSSGGRSFAQSLHQYSPIKKFSQSESEKPEHSKSGLYEYNKSSDAIKSLRLSLPWSSHHETKSYFVQHEMFSFHDHCPESHDDCSEADEKSKDSSCHLSSLKASSDFSCELEKDFDFLKACCPKGKAKETKKNVKLPEMPRLDKDRVRNLINCESKDIEASWQLDSSHKKTHKKPCPKQEKAQLSVKALVQASKAPTKTCSPKYSPLEHPEPEDISPELAAAMMFSQEQGVKMEECPRDTISLLFPEEPQPPFPLKDSVSAVDPNTSGKEDVIEKSASVPSEGVSDSAYTRTMRKKGEDVSPQRSYDVDFAIGQSKREYVFVTEKPQRVNVVQFRGGCAPPWFPWYFSAFPDEEEGLRLVNSPSGLFYKAWLHSNPKNIPTGDVIVLD